MDFVFIFANKFLSYSGAIMLFHSNDLQVLRQIREFLDSYSMSIWMKWVVLNNLPLINMEDLELKVFLHPISCQSCYAIWRLFISIFNVFLFSYKLYSIEPHFWWRLPRLWVPNTYYCHARARDHDCEGSRFLQLD